MKRKILIVDDEKSILDWMKIALEDKYEVLTYQDPLLALDLIKKERIDLVITDIKMPGISGLELLEEVKKINFTLPVIMITAYASIESAISAFRKGVSDYLIKPFSEEELIYRVEKHLPELEEYEEFIAVDEKMLEVKKIALKSAKSDLPIFIYGETGVGKEVLAKFIHKNSKRKERSFIAVNCAALPSELLESELFGYKKGAFTGAFKDKKGLLEVADGGTIFLDEISEMPSNLQTKLLRVIENKEIIPLGSVETKKIDIRIISATNRDPKETLKEGRLREDLYYRISAFPIYIPPLRERKKDIPALIEYFIKRISKKLKKDFTVQEEVVEILLDYNWKGNIRELENVIERACAICEGTVIKKEHLPFEIVEESITAKNLKELEEKLILEVLKEFDGNVKKAARKLGIHPSTIYRRLKKITKKNGK
ncbi:MAG: sigma-54 dependent transcriptional regulator [Candidatus Hydrothermales bacterium]